MATRPRKNWPETLKRLKKAAADAPTEKALTVAEGQFVAEYVKTQSAVAAYKLAYPKSVARSGPNQIAMAAQTVLRRARVQEAVKLFEAAKIDAIREDEKRRLIARHGRLAERVLTQDRVVAELHDIAYANIRDFLTFEEDGTPKFNLQHASDRQMASVAEIDVRVKAGAGGKPVISLRLKLHNKMVALKMLGDHLGMWPKDAGFIVPPAGAGDDKAKNRAVDARSKLLSMLEQMAIPAPLEPLDAIEPPVGGVAVPVSTDPETDDDEEEVEQIDPQFPA